MHSHSGAHVRAMALGVFLAPAALHAQATAPSAVAFVDVTVIPMTAGGARTLERQTVVVRDGKVAEIGPSARIRVPQGAVRVDARGKFLIPGLAEMHGHVPQQAGEFAERTLMLYVSQGVTTVRGMLGAPYHLQLRDVVKRGEILGPTLIMSSPAMSGNSVSTPETAARLVRQYKQQGYDLLKVHEGLSEDVYAAIVGTAREVGIPWGGHVSDLVGLKRALEAKQSTVDHLDNFVETLRSSSFGSGSEEERLASIVKATKDAGTSVVPTMALWDVFMTPEDSAAYAARPELRYMPRQMVGQWFQAAANFRANASGDAAGIPPLRRRILRALHQGGVPVLLGTDAPQIFSVPGFSIHREMRVMTEAGMTPYDILVSGTRNVAEYFATHFGMPRDFGTIEPGKRADLILLDANPLDDIGNVRRSAGVMVRGRWLDRAEIDRRLGAITS
ncbi:MAG TPA: amidohydrolase family protein [Gemmatimonadaceae bacterium]|nr:amidohydrolase family protein [Gemmatimonadaceae bacterium]